MYPDIRTLAQGVLQIFCSQDFFTIQNASQKSQITSNGLMISDIQILVPNVYCRLTKSCQTLIRSSTPCTQLYARYHDPRSNVSLLFAMSLMAKMHKSEKGHNLIKYSQNFTKC